MLWGLGGVGKTAISLKFARESLDRGNRVWWISASSASEVTVSMLELAKSLGAPEEQVRQSLAGGLNPADLLWSYLEREKKWLLILDNVDDIRTLTVEGREAGSGSGWLRPSRSGAILITSRLGDATQWGSLSKLHHVEPLDPHNSALLLQHIAPQAGSYDEAKALADTLGFLPLALHHAGAFLASPWSTHRRFSGYLNAVREDPTALVNNRVRGLATTWESSLDILGDQGVKQARPILRILSCFAGAIPIPKWFLQGNILAKVCGDNEQAVPEGFDVLAKVGLVEIIDSGMADDISLTIHPLVAEANRLYLGDGEESATVVSVTVDLIVRATQVLDPENPEHLSRWLEILPHITSCLANLGAHLTDEDAARLARASSFVASSLVYSGHYDAGLQVVNVAIRGIATGRSDIVEAGMLWIYHERAAILSFHGELRKAEQEYRSVAAARERLFEFNHPETLTTSYELVRVLGEQGSLSEALQLGQRIWESRQSILGVNHIDTLKTGALVAKIILKQGEAEQCFQICEALLNAGDAEHDHNRSLLTLSIRSLRAQALMNLEDFETARAELTSVLEARSAILRKGHPAILESRYLLSQALRSMGHPDDARRELRTVQSAVRANLPPGHPLAAKVHEGLVSLEGE
ncbi:tetratricopeptide (TPR) repeat protein [Streptosporangium lutulentum]|uniref:Tetratricopeptide (TPR) repeat protein n=1 Tax=Streptosporangium lutulentum TaxID=1461250 RepID=A0ABT9Q2E2_9ACTN|nr:tetratricopeptide (TPR) repeat protein [Streptosporangium lutulentum]